MKIGMLFIGLIVIIFLAFYIIKKYKETDHQHLTFKGKCKLFGLTFATCLIGCSVLLLGTSTSALGWEVLSIWLVKGIVLISLIMSYLIYKRLAY